MLSNENRLLIYCTHIRPSASTQDEIKKLLSLPLDWNEVLEVAAWYAIKPLLYHCLRNSPASSPVSQEIMSQLKISYDDIAARNMYIYATLARVLPLFNQKGIKCIVLKGAMLADTVYGDIGLRPMQDIDLLFHKDDVPRVIAILSELGYQHEGSKPPQHYLDNHYHITYTHPATDIPIEVHWHIAHDRNPGRLRFTDNDLMGGWFERACPVMLSNTETWTLCPSDLLFHLCVHFLKHRVSHPRTLFMTSSALLHLADMARTIDYYGNEIDWGHIYNQTEKYNITDLVAVTLQLVQEICHDESVRDGEAYSPFRLREDDFQYKGLMYEYLVLHRDMTLPLPAEATLPVRLSNLRLKARGLARSFLPAKTDLAQRYSIPETSRWVYFYYLVNPGNLARIFLLYLNQRPRIEGELKLYDWING